MKKAVLTAAFILILLAACTNGSVQENGDDAASQLNGSEPLKSISIDIGKIDFYIHEEYETDDLSALQKKYPDLVMIDSESLNGSHFETWQSNLSGMSYELYFWGEYEGASENQISIISGESSSLFTGLDLPVEVVDMMKSLEIPESRWRIGEPPPFSENYPDYAADRFWDVQIDDICLVMPDRVFGKYIIGIKIRPSAKGFVSPTDYFEIRNVGYLL